MPEETCPLGDIVAMPLEYLCNFYGMDLDLQFFLSYYFGSIQLIKDISILKRIMLNYDARNCIFSALSLSSFSEAEVPIRSLARLLPVMEAKLA